VKFRSATFYRLLRDLDCLYLQEEALDILTKSDAPLHYRAELLMDLAHCYTGQGEHELARDALLRLIKLEIQAHGPDSVLVALTTLQLGQRPDSPHSLWLTRGIVRCYLLLSDMERARTCQDRCAPILKTHFASDQHPVICELDQCARRITTARK
jgi:hypothetical protein